MYIELRGRKAWIRPCGFGREKAEARFWGQTRNSVLLTKPTLFSRSFLLLYHSFILPLIKLFSFFFLTFMIILCVYVCVCLLAVCLSVCLSVLAVCLGVDHWILINNTGRSLGQSVQSGSIFAVVNLDFMCDSYAYGGRISLIMSNALYKAHAHSRQLMHGKLWPHQEIGWARSFQDAVF